MATHPIPEHVAHGPEHTIPHYVAVGFEHFVSPQPYFSLICCGNVYNYNV